MKKTKLLALILALCLVISSFAVVGMAVDSEPVEYAVLGDADGDGVVDARDLVVMRKFLANLDYDSGISTVKIYMSADMDDNGYIRAYDLYLLRNYIANGGNEADGSYSKGLKYTSNGGGTCRVEGIGSCTDEVIIIPSTSPSGEKVIEVNKNAFKDRSDIVSVILPSSVTDVGMNAFENCSNLIRIYIPKSVTYVGSNAFLGCHDSLTVYCQADEQPATWGYNWHNGVRNVVWGFVKNSSGLEFTSNGDGTCCVSGMGDCTDTDVVIPTYSTDGDLVIKVGDGAFCNTNITSVYIPASVETIGDAFEKCTELVSVDFADESALTVIASFAFWECSSLESIVIPEGATHIGDYAFFNCASLKSVVIPTSVISIGNETFKKCASLESIIIPAGVQNIASAAFADCDNLTIYCEADSMPNTWSGSWNSTNCPVVWGYAPEEPITGERYGRTTLSAKAAIAYDLLEAGIMCDAPQSAIDFDVADEITVDDLHYAINMLISDHPECFWWGGEYGYSYNEENGFVVAVTPDYDYTGSELEAMRADLEEVIFSILSGIPHASNFEKALYLHDKVAEIVTYQSGVNDQNAYGALIEREAVCNGYATAYQLLLQRAGINAWIVKGQAEGGPHAWNVVWLADGVCVYTDVTWNDQSDLMHYYFNMSLDEIDDDHFADELYELPECGHTEYSYPDVVDTCNVLNETDGGSKLAEFFVDEGNGVKKAQFYYTGDDFSNWLQKNNNAQEVFALVGGEGMSTTYLGNEYIVVIQ